MCDRDVTARITLMSELKLILTNSDATRVLVQSDYAIICGGHMVTRSSNLILSLALIFTDRRELHRCASGFFGALLF